MQGSLAPGFRSRSCPGDRHNTSLTGVSDIFSVYLVVPSPRRGEGQGEGVPSYMDGAAPPHPLASLATSPHRGEVIPCPWQRHREILIPGALTP